MTEVRPSLAVVLEHYGVMVKPNKVKQMVRCPIHRERRASCTVALEGPDDEWFRCHACDAKGDVFDLVMRMESCDFKAALAVIEGIPGAKDGRVREAPRPRRSVSGSSGSGPRYVRPIPARVRRKPLLD